jgi:outer membrane murein-binding lipoprotein Lpp
MKTLNVKPLVQASIFALIAVALVIGVASRAKADEFGSDYEAFSTQIRDLQKHCRASDTTCALANVASNVLFDRQDHVMHPHVSGLLAKFDAIAREQALIWADTILEGDYQTDEKTQLDRVEALYKDGNFIGYRIEYSERAWDTSDCEEANGRYVLSTCVEGRIREASFVSPKLTSWTRDDFAYASFLSL